MKDVLIGMAVTWGPFIVLILIGLSFGTIAQRRHIADLNAREAALGDVLLTNIGQAEGVHTGVRGELVTGSTVVAYDFFRRVAIMLRKIVGGRFYMHEKMMARARREAVLRMAETARDQGADAVHNIRLVTSNLGNSGSAMGGCEVLAYGTAVWSNAALDSSGPLGADAQT